MAQLRRIIQSYAAGQLRKLVYFSSHCHAAMQQRPCCATDQWQAALMGHALKPLTGIPQQHNRSQFDRTAWLLTAWCSLQHQVIARKYRSTRTMNAQAVQACRKQDWMCSHYGGGGGAGGGWWWGGAGGGGVGGGGGGEGGGLGMRKRGRKGFNSMLRTDLRLSQRM